MCAKASTNARPAHERITPDPTLSCRLAGTLSAAGARDYPHPWEHRDFVVKDPHGHLVAIEAADGDG
jgi:hypothetical protein